MFIRPGFILKNKRLFFTFLLLYNTVCIAIKLYLLGHFTRVHAKSIQSCPTVCDPMDCM